MGADPTGPVAELLSQLIRNGCVNDGTVASGQEAPPAELLAGWLKGPGLDLQRLRLSTALREAVVRDLLG